MKKKKSFELFTPPPILLTTHNKLPKIKTLNATSKLDVEILR